jgi:hypothetical protein
MPLEIKRVLLGAMHQAPANARSHPEEESGCNRGQSPGLWPGRAAGRTSRDGRFAVMRKLG